MTEERIKQIRAFRSSFPTEKIYVTLEGATYTVRFVNEYFFHCYIPGERPDYTINFDRLRDEDVSF